MPDDRSPVERESSLDQELPPVAVSGPPVTPDADEPPAQVDEQGSTEAGRR